MQTLQFCDQVGLLARFAQGLAVRLGRIPAIWTEHEDKARRRHVKHLARKRQLTRQRIKLKHTNFIRVLVCDNETGARRVELKVARCSSAGVNVVDVGQGSKGRVDTEDSKGVVTTVGDEHVPTSGVNRYSATRVELGRKPNWNRRDVLHARQRRSVVARLDLCYQRFVHRKHSNVRRNLVDDVGDGEGGVKFNVAGSVGPWDVVGWHLACRSKGAGLGVVDVLLDAVLAEVGHVSHAANARVEHNGMCVGLGLPVTQVIFPLFRLDLFRRLSHKAWFLLDHTVVPNVQHRQGAVPIVDAEGTFGCHVEGNVAGRFPRSRLGSQNAHLTGQRRHRQGNNLTVFVNRFSQRIHNVLGGVNPQKRWVAHTILHTLWSTS
eukprot:m.121011 g.121011  ORF g.121011 m.121011 type:complete len:377 (+) comp16522_c0_seq2:115-1245(+)